MRSVPLLAPPALLAPAAPAAASPTPNGPSRVEGYVVDRPGPGRFPPASRGRAAAIVVSDADHPGVVRVVGDLPDDVERVTGVRPELATLDGTSGRTAVPRGDVVIVGTVGRSPLIDGLVERGTLDVSTIAGRWETSLQQVVHDPVPGVRRAFVIAGSDQRGTIFGAYDVSREIGVSPRHWWADVPPAHRAELHVLPGRHGQGTPAVKYRGFSVDDENPALGRWAPRHFGNGHAPGSPALAGGKWHGFQTQPKIGCGDVARYGPTASWQQPERDGEALPDAVFPAVERVDLPQAAEMGVAVDGPDQWWPAAGGSPALPAFSPHQSQPGRYVDVFNRGTIPFDYRATPGAAWLHVDRPHGTVDDQVRLDVRVDWSRAPKGRTTVPIEITGAGVPVTVHAVVEHDLVAPRGFVEANGYVSIEAANATRVVAGDGVRWRRIPDLGRTGDAMEPFPVTAPSREPLTRTGPRLEHDLTVRSDGPVTVWAHLSPRNPVLPGPGLRYAVSFDDQPPQVVDITAATGADDTTTNRQRERNTSDNVNRTATGHRLDAGAHTLEFWVVDPTVVVQKLVVDSGGLRSSYLGPPESRGVH